MKSKISMVVAGPIGTTGSLASQPSSTGTLDSAYHSEDSNPPACGVEGVPARVIEEVVDTERAYLRDLTVIQKGYIDAMRQDDRFTSSVVDLVFSNLPALCAFHKEFLVHLEASLHKELSSFCTCFTESAAEFEALYIDYCTNFPNSLVRLEHLLAQPESAEFFSTCQSNLRLMLPLHTYLLKPVQRILKYHLLLESLYKSLKPLDQGALARRIAPAVDAMTTVAAHINEVQRRHEHALRVRELASLLKSARLNLADLGELVLEDTFQLHGKKGDRQVFLFHQAILIAKRQQTSGYLVIKDFIKCANLMLIESIPEQPSSFHVLPYDNPKSQHTLQARTLDQKRHWCQEIKRLILENYHRAIPEKAKHIVMNMNELIEAGTSGGAAGGGVRRKSATAPVSLSGGHSPQKGRRPSEHGAVVSPTSAGSGTAPMAMVEDLPSMWKIGEDLHEEVWKEWLARHSAFYSSSSSEEEEEEEPAGPILPEDGDFRCIAVEINEERMLSSSAGSSGVRHRHHHRPPTDHRRQPSTGRASELLRHTIDNAIGASSASSNGAATKTEDGLFSIFASGKSDSAKHSKAIYIHCPPAGSYSNVSFGRAYEQYIEKTKNKIMLSPSDIDEIFQPLALAKQRPEEPPPPPPPATLSMLEEAILDEEEPVGSPCSSGGSSPRHIVSRIAASSLTNFGTLASARVVHWSARSEEGEEEEEEEVAAASSGRSGGGLMNGLRSKLKKSSSNGSIKRSESADNSSTSSAADLPSEAKGTELGQERRGSIVSRFMRAYGRGSKRDKKGSEDSGDGALSSLPAASAPSSPLPSLAGRRFTKAPPAQQPQPSLQAAPQAAPQPIPQPAQQSPRKKHRAPPIPSTAVRSESFGPRSAPQPPTRCPSAPVGSPEQIANAGRDDSVESVCQGRVRAAMHHLMDSLPYADDSAEAEAAAAAAAAAAVAAAATTAAAVPKGPRLSRSFKSGQAGQAVQASPSNRSVDDWQSADNCYWKKALLQSDPKPAAATVGRSQGVALAGAVTNGRGAPFPKVRSNSSSGLAMAGSLRGAAGHPPQKIRPRLGAAPDRAMSVSGPTSGGDMKESGGEEEAEPPRGLVRNMVSRFQKPT